MRIEIERKRPHDTPLTLFLFHIRKGTAWERSHNFFHVGRLYKGYIGIMINIKKIGAFDLWIYNMEKDRN